MLTLYRNKKVKYTMCSLPMKDEANAGVFDNHGWAYINDGKEHGRIPAIVLQGLVDMFGGEEYIRASGYTKHWLVFRDDVTGEYFFSNKPSGLYFAQSEYERQQAQSIPPVDIALLEQL